MQSFKSKLFQNENNMRDVKDILDEAQESMDMAIMYLDEALAHIRAGKADIRLLDGIRVDSYGSMVPINNVAAVTTPDARSIAIKPWDRACSASLKRPSLTPVSASCPKTMVRLSVSASRH